MNCKYLLSFLLLSITPLVIAQTAIKNPDIHMVYMGGNDCPPCQAWRAVDMPKLEKTAAFKSIKFSYVWKAIRSPVPSAAFLPDEVKPYKEKLDRAASSMTGSSQTAILVNGEVYDYYWGTRSAEDIEKMILSIKSGEPYPFERCLKMYRGNSKSCEVKG